MVVKKILVMFLLTSLFVCAAAMGSALADDLEKGLRHDLQQSHSAIARAQKKLQGRESIAAEAAVLKGLGEKVRASHLLMIERLRQRKDQASLLGANAISRQSEVAEAYTKAMDEYLALVDSLPPDGSVSPATLELLNNLIDKIAPPKKRPIIGALPYKHLAYPASEPATGPVLVPAYKGGNRTVAQADTAASAEAPISKEIADLAQSLQWNPVLIYEWVKNNVETEWYWGAMKGAEETLRQKSGNDADQAALLTALLRASGFPTRFVKGTIEFFPGIDKAKELTGIGDPLKIAAFFQKAGIPFKPIIAAGKIGNIQVEHVWVESLIPYSNYRGAVVDEMGKSWLALDTSIKAAGYISNTPIDVPATVTENIVSEYLGAVQSQTPLQYLQGKVGEYLTANQPGKQWQDVLASRQLNQDVLNIIPAGMQFKQVAITGEYTELPAELRHQVKFTASNGDTELFSLSLDLIKLSNRKVILTYEPETVEDQQIVDSYGGLDNTPSYLVRLRPALQVDGERMAVGGEGLPMGADYSFSTVVQTPNGTETIRSTQIAGNVAAIGIVAQKAAAVSIPNQDDDADTILWKEAMGYIGRWNVAEEEFAAFSKLAIARPVATVVTVGGVIEVSYLLDMPHGFEWKGVFIDAALRGIETVSTSGEAGTEKSFMRLSALQGSILENRIFEDDLQVESVSTAKFLQLAAAGGVPTVSIDKSNVEAVLPTLPFEDAVKADIADSVNSNLTVTIPQTEISYRNWTGVGYLKENPETGESGWMLSGSIAGGQSVDAADAWAQWYLSQTLSSPYSKNNKDPMSAQRILKVQVTDRQNGTVSLPISQPLAVLVLDSLGRPVQGADVTFKMVAGGGSLVAAGSPVQLVVKTGANGVAKAGLILGKYTADNPVYVSDQQNPNAWQVGQNIVSASVTGRYGAIALNDDFQALGWPGAPDHIKKVLGEGNSALANNPAGSLVAVPVDWYENPVSNVPLLFQGQTSTLKYSTNGTLPEQTRNIQFYAPESCSAAYPLYGDCATAASITGKSAYYGTVINTILGNTVATDYTVKVSVPSKPEVTPAYFHLSTDGYRTSGGYIPPGLFIRNLELVNDSGESISATKAGTLLAAPLVSELFMMYDDYKLTPRGDGYYTLSWPGTVSVKPVKDGTVSYSAVTGNGSLTPTTNLGTGRYKASLTTGVVPAANNVEALGAAQVSVPQALLSNFMPNGTVIPSFAASPPAGYVDSGKSWTITTYPPEYVTCTDSGCKLAEVFMNLYSGQQAIFFSIDPSGWRASGELQKAKYTTYGVDIRFSLDPPVIAVIKEGKVKLDKKFNFTVLPSEYHALRSQVDFLTTDSKEGQTFMGYLPGNLKDGQWDVTMVAGSHFDITKNYLARVTLNSGSAAEIQGSKVPFVFVYGALVPDYNHDRKIDSSDTSRAEHGDLYYFWANDDDGSGDTEGTGIPGTRHYPLSNMIPGTRDLVDWFPVRLEIADVLTKLDPTKYRYQLRHETANIDDLPEFRYVYTTLSPANSGRYLTDVPTAQTIIEGSTIRILPPFSNVSVLDTQFLKNITNDNYGVLLMEAVTKTQKPIFLEVYDSAGQKVFETSLGLSIDGVEQMFRHKSLVQYIEGPATVPAERLEGPTNFPDSECTGTSDGNGKNFVFVHGYNVNPQQARGWQAEMFKRLYWSGSRAKFWGVTWFGWDSQLLGKVSPDYHLNVIHAFDTALFLQDFLRSEVRGDITIAAHSLGNMVVSTALSDYADFWSANAKSVDKNAARVTRYFMLDAAVAKEAYDGSEPLDISYPDISGGPDVVCEGVCMDHPQWKGYDSRLYASQWFKLFNSSDARSKITWQNRFAKRPSGTTFYNLYSPGEEVLGGHKGAPSIIDTGIMKQTGRYTWALQEKLKGRQLDDWNYDIIGSPYGGWGFNPSYLTEYDIATGKIFPIAPSVINPRIDSDPSFLLTLRTTPLFSADADDAKVFDETTGAAEAADRVVRNRLLAKSIPARTLPAGSSAAVAFGNNNFDMQSEFRQKGAWPASRLGRDEPNWKHGDAREVAYPYIYQLFDFLVKKGPAL